MNGEVFLLSDEFLISAVAKFVYFLLRGYYRIFLGILGLKELDCEKLLKMLHLQNSPALQHLQPAKNVSYATKNARRPLKRQRVAINSCWQCQKQALPISPRSCQTLPKRTLDKQRLAAKLGADQESEFKSNPPSTTDGEPKNMEESTGVR